MHFNFVKFTISIHSQTAQFHLTELSRLFSKLIQNTISIRMANVVEPKQNTHLNVNR